MTSLRQLSIRAGHLASLRERVLELKADMIRAGVKGAAAHCRKLEDDLHRAMDHVWEQADALLDGEATREPRPP